MEMMSKTDLEIEALGKEINATKLNLNLKIDKSELSQIWKHL